MRVAALTIALCLFSALPAAANECMALWLERNAYFANKGYCFGSALGKGVFGNSGCHTKSPSMNASEKSRISQIKSREKRLGCASQKKRWSSAQVRSYARQLTSRAAPAPAPAPRRACSRRLQFTFDMAAGNDLNPRLSVSGPNTVNIYANGSYADIDARGNNCVNGRYSYNYAVEYSHLVDGRVPYNYRGSFTIGPNTRSCYIYLSRSGGRPSIDCN